MKAPKVLLIASLSIASILSACQKGRMIDNYPSENYYNVVPANVNFWSIDTIKRSIKNIEAGIVFHAKYDGAITYLASRLPDSNLNVRISIWEYDTGKRLHLTTLKIDSANQVHGTEISDVSIEKSKKYVLSMNSNAWYYYHNLSELNGVPYPLEISQIVVDGFVMDSLGGGTIMPQDSTFNNYIGDVGFSFRRAGAAFK